MFALFCGTDSSAISCHGFASGIFCDGILKCLGEADGNLAGDGELMIGEELKLYVILFMISKIKLVAV
jgi:hypothetical protein